MNLPTVSLFTSVACVLCLVMLGYYIFFKDIFLILTYCSQIN